jgi:FkbM family methyltransferase
MINPVRPKISRTAQRLASRFGFHLLRNHRYPAHTLMGLQRAKFGTVFDVGANSGQFARIMHPRFPAASFHCFEPTPAAFTTLSAWAATVPRVVPVHAALGEVAGTMAMNLHTDHDTSSSLLATTAQNEALYPFMAAQSKIDVKVMRLDDYVAGLAAPLAGDILLKLDVQGFEAPVLRGAPKLLAQVRACITEVNIDELYQGQSRFADIVALMTAAGLQYAGNFHQEYDTDGHVIYIDAMFQRGGGSEV